MSPHVSREARSQVEDQARNRCGYCLSHQRHVMGRLEIDHIVPLSPGGTDDIDNLWLACRLCNRHKSDQIAAIDPETDEFVPLFNPRKQQWHEHFMWSEDGTQIIGVTACGRATVAALNMNNPIAVTVREGWVSAGWHPPSDVIE